MDNQKKIIDFQEYVDQIKERSEDGSPASLHETMREIISQYLRYFPDQVPEVLKIIYLTTDSAQRRSYRGPEGSD